MSNQMVYLPIDDVPINGHFFYEKQEYIKTQEKWSPARPIGKDCTWYVCKPVKLKTINTTDLRQGTMVQYEVGSEEDEY